MRLAIDASEAARGSTSPNPPVGAVILDASGAVVGVGATRPPGGPHAEVVALAAAGERARGGTAVVTLEPCNHQGRTGPCSRALIDAGIAAVHYSVADPNPAAAGGARHPACCAHRGDRRAARRRRRTRTSAGMAAPAANRTTPCDVEVRRHTRRSQRRRRRHQPVDYRTGGAGARARRPGAARRDRRRNRHRPGGRPVAHGPAADGSLAPHQPLRVVVGNRPVPSTARSSTMRRPPWYCARTTSRDPLCARRSGRCPGRGGPRLAGAFLAAGVVDRVQAYIAPVVLGAGSHAVEDAGVSTITEALRFRRENVEVLGDDLLLNLIPRAQ